MALFYCIFYHLAQARPARLKPAKFTKKRFRNGKFRRSGRFEMLGADENGGCGRVMRPGMGSIRYGRRAGELIAALAQP
jgi:hypothetical protein